MIGPLPEELQHLQRAPGLRGSELHDLQQRRLGEMHRAGSAHQDRLLGKHRHRLAVQLVIRVLAGFLVLAALDEGRRIQHHDVEALAGRGETLDLGAGLPLDEAHAALDAVKRGVLRRQRERGSGAVDAADVSSARHGRLYTPGAHVAEDIEHAAASRQRCHARAARAVVEEPARLLAFLRTHAKARAVLLELEELGDLAMSNTRVNGQLLQGAHGGVVTQQDARGLQQHIERCDHLRQQPFHPRGAHLHHQVLTEAIHHQSRETITVAIGQTIKRLAEEPLAQAQGSGQPRLDQGGANCFGAVTVDQPGADQRMRIDQRDPEGPAARTLKQRLVACLEALQGCGVGIDLVAVDPGVALAHAPVFVTTQLQRRQRAHAPPTMAV